MSRLVDLGVALLAFLTLVQHVDPAPFYVTVAAVATIALREIARQMEER